MAVSQATLLAKVSALEKRVGDLSAKVKADETALQAVLGMSSSQLSALSALSASQLSALATLSPSQLTAMNAVTAFQYATLATTNIAFLASLRQTPHLANDNSTTDTWDNAGRALWNQLKASMVDTNIMA